LKPGEKKEVLAGAGAFGQLTARHYEGLKPGTYRLTARYVMTRQGKVAGGQAGGQPDGPVSEQASELLGKVWQGSVTSNAVTVRFATAPETAELLKILDGERKGILSAAEAIHVLGGRREQKGLEPTIKALSSKDTEVRRAAASALRHYAAAFSVGQLRDPEIIPNKLLSALRAASSDLDAQVRQEAKFSLRCAQDYRKAVKEKK
jgi:hypothetical protein